ncbi:MAG: hypothetical protein EOO01_36090 [Chitinophagaceae bacterium]|nr:MAG: hypothetical protein EOO01_36090 [Chitinophagaceae bacterium]
MWYTESLWFEIAVVSIIFAAGNILFGLFEERTPRVRKLIKYLVTMGLVLLISFYAGRSVAMIALGICFIPVIYVHAFYLPRKGINGWTGEPKSRYYEFRNWDKDIFKDS